jgi:uncharacterized protein (TIGR00290 family)
LAPVTHGKTLLAWSSGKDAAWTLSVLRAQGVDVVGLLTTMTTQPHDVERARVAMHDVPHALVEMQAAATGLPLHVAHLPWPCPNDAYEAAMAGAMARAHRDGVRSIAFGDLFLEDIRAYREAKLLGTGISPLFPLFGRDTKELARAMIAGGLRARLACVDTRRVEARLAGAEFDDALLAALPDGVDPCGERGEFHTFAFDGPMFRAPIPVAVVSVTERDGFAYADLRSDAGAAAAR